MGCIASKIVRVAKYGPDIKNDPANLEHMTQINDYFAYDDVNIMECLPARFFILLNNEKTTMSGTEIYRMCIQKGWPADRFLMYQNDRSD